MTDSKESELTKWFRENYPVEALLAREINIQVNTIFSQVGMEQDVLPIDLFQMKAPEGGSRLGMREGAVIFYGALARAIIETVFKNIQNQIPQNLNQQLENQARKVMKEYIEKHSPLIIQDFKRCPKCSLDNDYENKFCGQCGTALEQK